MRLGFMDDPDEGGVANHDESSSWGGFQIWVGGVNLCAHLEQGERIESVHWYLLPMLEWFVRNWDPLLHEERLPCRSRATTGWLALRQSPAPPFEIDEAQEEAREAEWQAWWSRHAIAAAREGGLFPDVVFRRLRDTIEVSWGAGKSPGTPDHVSFDVSQPAAEVLPVRTVADALYQILEWASEHLAAMSPSSRVAALVRDVKRLARPRVHDRLMWVAGLGADAQTMRRRWRVVRHQIGSCLPEEHSALMLKVDDPSRLAVEGSCHAALMFGSLDPRVERVDVVALCQMAMGLTSAEGVNGPWSTFTHTEPVDSQPTPWAQGYGLADALHERLDDADSTGDFVDIDGLLHRLEVRVTRISLTDARIRGIAIAGPEHQPGIAWNDRCPFNATLPGRRFTLAHELCHVLVDWAVGRRLSMASGPWAPERIEQRANAFAAMLLMPPARVQRALGSLNEPVATEASIGFIASRLQTGFEATLRHLNNLSLIEDIDLDRILAQREADRATDWHGEPVP